MSDNFDNNDDLDWLRNSDDDDSEERPEEDLDLDWLKDHDDDAGAPVSGRTGVTGELSWLQDNDSSPDNAGNEDNDAFDWQATSPDEDDPRRERSGLTGQLDWQSIDERFEDQLGDMEDDLSGQFSDSADFDEEASEEADFDESQGDALEISQDDLELPPWLQGLPVEQVGESGALEDADVYGEDAYDEIQDAAPSGEALPSWLSESDDFAEADADEYDAYEQEDPAPASGEIMPSWLSQADEFDDEYASSPAADDAYSETTTGQQAPSWLSEADDFAEEDLPNSSFQQADSGWLDEESDDFDLGGFAEPQTEDQGATSDWLSEADEFAAEFETDDQNFGSYADDFGEDQEDAAAPDWLNAAESFTQSGDELPDFGDLDEFAAPQGIPDEELPDLFDLVGDEDSAELPADLGLELDADAAPDWFTAEADVDVPDWFTADEPLAAAVPQADLGGGQEDELADFDLGSFDETDARFDDLFAEDAEALETTFDAADSFAAEPDMDEFDLDDADLDALFEEPDSYEAVEFTAVDHAAQLPDEFDDNLIDETFALDDSLFDDAEAMEEDLFGEAELDDYAADADQYDDLFAEPYAEDEDALPQMDTGYLRDMGIVKPPEADTTPATPDRDWFSEFGDEEEEAADSENMGWLNDLDQLEDEDSSAVPAEASFLAELDMVIESSKPPQTADLSFEDIDSFLATLDDSEVTLPKTDELSLATNTEFDDLFAGGTFESLDEPREAEPAPPTLEEDYLEAAGAEWLEGLAASVSEESATALVRQRDDRPLDELPERLRELSERGRNLSVGETALDPAAEVAKLLPGVKNPLAPAPIAINRGAALSDELQLSEQQRERARLLKELVGVGGHATRLAATEEGIAADFAWEDDHVEVAKAGVKPIAPRKIRKQRVVVRLDQLIITMILLLGVGLPFFINLKAGNLPPQQFAAGSRQQIAFEAVDSLLPGQLALVGIEYGPTTAAELDSATEALLRHIISRGARPVLVGSNPTGLLHASNILAALGTDSDSGFLTVLGRGNQALVADQDYYVTRYLTGGVVGVRAFGQDIANLVRTDVKGRETGLTVNGLDDFALVVVISDTSDTMRAWAEQIVPLTDAPLVVVSAFSAAPLAEPYVQAVPGTAGLLVGYRDAYTYSEMLNTMLYGALPTETPPPTITPTSPPATETPLATDAQVIPAESTDEVQETLAPTATASPTATLTASPTVTNTATPTSTATYTPSPTNTYTPSPTPLPIALVTSSQAVNVRSGPGTTFQPVSTLRPGTEILVLGENEDGTWLNILLGDGTVGWVSASLLQIQTPAPPDTQEATPTPEQLRDINRAPRTLSRPQIRRTFNVTLKVAALLQDAPEATEEAAPTASPSATPQPSPTATLEADPQVTPTLGAFVLNTGSVPRPPQPLKDERWYAMTLGLGLAIVIIALGNLYNIARFLFRRGRS